MAVVSKTEDVFGKLRIMKVVKFSGRNKQFEIDLPEAAHLVCGEKVVDNTLDGVNKKFKDASEIFISSTEKKVKVVVLEFLADAIIERGGKTIFKNTEWGNYDGVSLKLRCEVYNKHTWTLHDGDKVSKYLETPHNISESASFDYTPSVGYKDTVEIPWSKERERFFIQLVESFEELILKLNDFTKNVKSVIRLVDGGLKLLEAPKPTFPPRQKRHLDT